MDHAVAIVASGRLRDSVDPTQPDCVWHVDQPHATQSQLHPAYAPTHLFVAGGKGKMKVFGAGVTLSDPKKSIAKIEQNDLGCNQRCAASYSWGDVRSLCTSL